MSKIVTLRISEDNYGRLKTYAKAENRNLSNAIETLALKQLDEELYVGPEEMESILHDEGLLKDLKAGHEQAKKRKGRFVE